MYVECIDAVVTASSREVSNLTDIESKFAVFAKAIAGMAVSETPKWHSANL